MVCPWSVVGSQLVEESTGPRIVACAQGDRYGPACLAKSDSERSDGVRSAISDGNRMEMPLDILYDDGPCLVVNKPAGVLTQAPAGIDSMEVRVKEFYREREGKEGNIYLGLPHRLDRPVTGAIVFARHVRAAQRLSSQFENRTVTQGLLGTRRRCGRGRRRDVDRSSAQAARHGAIDRGAGR